MAQRWRSVWMVGGVALLVGLPGAGWAAGAKDAATALYERGDLAQAEAALPKGVRELAPGGDGLAHEVAAWLTEGRGDADASFRHWLLAIQDADYDGRRLALQRALERARGRAQRMELAHVAESLLGDDDPEVAAQARWAAVEARWLLGDVDRARELRDGGGYIRAWQAIAGFENEQMKGFDVAYPPESEIALDATYPGQLREVSWRAIDAMDYRGFVPHIQLQTPNNWSVGYLATWVKSPKKRRAQLRVTSAEPVKAWLNGKLALSERYVEWARPDHLVAAVELREGWNLLLVKTCQDEDDWLTAVRLTDEDGRALEGLQLSTAPQEVGKLDAPGEANPAHGRFGRTFAKAEPPARRDVLRAYTFYKEGFVKEASNRFDAAVKAHPRNVVAWLLGSGAALEAKEEEKALLRFAKGVEAWPEMTRFWAARTGYFLERDRADRALQDLAELMQRAPDSVETRDLEVRIYQAKGWKDEACSVTERMSAAHPDHPVYWHGLARCAREHGRYAEMAKHYEQVVELEPTDLDALDELASYALWQDDFAKAEALWARGLALYPERTQPYLELAEILRRERRWEEAQARFEQAATLDPEYAYPYKELGAMWIERGEEDHALQWWRQALDRNPNDHSLWERVEMHEADAAAPYLALVPTDAQIDALIAKAGDVEVVPGASHVFLLDDEITAVNQDGSVRRIVTNVARIEDEQGRDAFSSIRLPGGGRTRVLKAYSIDPEGKLLEVSSLRQGWVRFQDLKPGSLFVLQYRHDEGRSRFLQNHWSSTWRFQQTEGQTERARWVAFVPKDRQLSIFRRGNIRETVAENAEHRIYTWTAEHVEPLLPEPQSPPAGDLLWTVQVSTVPSWDFIARWEWTMVEDALRLTPDIPELAARIVPKSATPAEKVEAIYRYAARDIRYEQDYAEPIEGVRPHQTSVTVERGYGDCKDKTVVMMTLLRSVGVEARFAMLSTAGAGQAILEVPAQQFNHAIVYVPAQPGIPKARFYDPTAETLDLGNLRWDDQGQQALVLWEGGHEFIPIPFDPADKEKTHFEIGLELSANPTELATARVVVTSRGRWAAGLRSTLRNEETGRKLVEGLGGGLLFVGADLVSYEVKGIDDILEPVVIVATYRVPNLVVEDAGRLRVEVDEYLKLALQQARWPKRRYPLFLGPPTLREVTVHFKVPEGYRVARLPQAAKVEDACMRFAMQATERSPHEGEVHYTVETTCARVEPDAYGSYRNALVALTRAFTDKPLLAPEAAHAEREY